MSLTVYGFKDYPNLLAVTKTDAPLEECVFFLDFTRPISKRRWLGFGKYGILNNWIGPLVGLGAPVVHAGEVTGGYIISVHITDPYFFDVIKWWKQYGGSRAKATGDPVGGLQIIADFYRHFPADSQTV